VEASFGGDAARWRLHGLVGGAAWRRLITMHGGGPKLRIFLGYFVKLPKKKGLVPAPLDPSGLSLGPSVLIRESSIHGVQHGLCRKFLIFHCSNPDRPTRVHS
jgi:hypothetical protein